MLVAKLPGIDVGDARDERGPEERQEPEARAVERLVDRPQPARELFLCNRRSGHGQSLAETKLVRRA